MNAIINALAIKENAQSSTNVNSSFIDNNGYLKNSICSLFSAKINNPDCDSILITNFKLPEKYMNELNDLNIKTYLFPFDRFVFPDNMAWSLAFYKLCALSYVIQELNYDNICLLDTDTVCVKPLDSLWDECRENILLYDMQHSLEIEQANVMNQEFHDLTHSYKYLINYGGEFIAGSRDRLIVFLEKCRYYYDQMIKKKLTTKHGDEFILCCAASDSDVRSSIKSANAYIFRFWTSSFYLISTNYIYNPICILHVPDEKNRGMLCLYKYISKKKKLPIENKLYRMLNLPTKRSPFRKKVRLISHILYCKIYS